MGRLTIQIFPSSPHQLSASLTLICLISILIVSFCPSRSSSLSNSEISISSSFISSYSSVNSLILQEKSTGTLPSSSPVIITGNQFPSMFSSFSFPQQKRDEQSRKPISSQKSDRRDISGSSSTSSMNSSKRNLGINNNNNNNRSSQQLVSYVAKDRNAVFNSASGSGRGNSAIDDIDKSDNQISSHQRHLHEVIVIAPSQAKTKNKIYKHSVVISREDDESDAYHKQGTVTSTTARPAEGSNSAGARTTTTTVFSLDRPRHNRQFNYQHVWLSSLPTAIPAWDKELLNKKSAISRHFQKTGATAATTFVTSSAAFPGETVFIRTAIQDHRSRDEEKVVSTRVMMKMPLESRTAINSTDTRMKRAAKRNNATQVPTILTILGLFELTENSLPRESGRSEKIAAEMALEDINAKGILKGSRLIMHTNDTQFVCIGGTPKRMEEFAYFIMNEIGYKIPTGTQLLDISQFSYRYSMYKTGPVLSISHGMGIPSVSILLHEIIKLMYHARVSDPIFFRIGTCGGIGIDGGNVIITEEALNADLKPYQELTVLGKKLRRPSKLDKRLRDELLSIANSSDEPFDTVTGKTMCTDDFYEGQGRLDGAFCEFTEKEKMSYIHHLQRSGVTNIEMESLAFAALTHHAGIRAAVVCVSLLDRIRGDQVLAQKEVLNEWQRRPQKLVARYINQQLGLLPMPTKILDLSSPCQCPHTSVMPMKSPRRIHMVQQESQSYD